jgi:hypothetical protein
MRTALNLILASLFCVNSWSQGLYLSASTGYNFGVNRSNFENYTINKLVSVFYPYEIDRDPYSLGKGANFSLGLGYTTKHHIGFELEGSYLLGLKTIAKSQYIADDIFQKEIWGRFYRINPSIYFINQFNKFSLKLTLGGLVGFGKMYLDQKAIYKDVEWFSYKNEFRGGSYLGFRIGTGVLIPINRRLNFSFDVNWMNAHFSPGKSKITKFMNGPYDYTDKISTGEKEINYSSSIKYEPYDPNQPSHALKKYFEASSIGLQVGVQWSLWKKKEKEEKEEKTDENK